MVLTILKTATSFLLISILNCNPLFSQSRIIVKQDSALSKSIDIVDVLQGGFKIPFRKDSASMKEKQFFVSILPVVGYSLQSGLTWAIVTNTSFYADEGRSRFSNLLINAYYSQYHQYWITVNNNLFFEKSKIHLLGDTRYYNFPTHTFGLGTNSTLADELDINFSYLRISQIVFREITSNLFAGIGFNLDYHWNIVSDTIPGKALNDLKIFQKDTHSFSSGISLDLLYDNRKNSVNPEFGSYAYIQYRPNLTFFGSETNWQSLLIDLRHYIKFPASSRNVLALWNYNNFSIKGIPPYLDMPSVGWDSYSNTGRGYVPGRYTGKNFSYFESEYRFALTGNGLLGGVVFGNAETVFQKWSARQSIIPGGGIGIRIKINKYSNTNLAIDYGFGVGGSRGLFFNLGEVF